LFKVSTKINLSDGWYKTNVISGFSIIEGECTWDIFGRSAKMACIMLCVGLSTCDGKLIGEGGGMHTYMLNLIFFYKEANTSPPSSSFDDSSCRTNFLMI